MVTKMPKATIRRMANEINSEIRISGDALSRIQDLATDFVRMTVSDSYKLAQHSNRKTILEKDVLLATE